MGRSPNGKFLCTVGLCVLRVWVFDVRRVKFRHAFSFSETLYSDPIIGASSGDSLAAHSAISHMASTGRR